MLDGRSPWYLHALQNISLILLSFIFLPIDTTVLFFSYAVQAVFGLCGKHHRAHSLHHAGNPRTVLVTGVGMTKGLTLARLFRKAGHRVIGADFEPHGVICPGRVSCALHSFYRLEKSSVADGSARYLQDLLDVIIKEKVDLWVSCSGVASAVEDGEAKEIIENRTNCRAVQFDVTTTQKLHEKHTFMSHTQKIGLNIPQTHTITSREDVRQALNHAPAGMQFILKTIGMNDQARGDMTLLPLQSQSATEQHLSRLEISPKNQWILQQFISGREYCTHALIIHGKVVAFIACPSSELLMHYTLLPGTTALSQAMLRFTREYAENGGQGFTGHLSFDFLVEDLTNPDPGEIVLYPIECNPRAHTAVALFNDTPALVDAYLSLLDTTDADLSSLPHELVVPVNTAPKYYWIGHDLISNILYPLLQLMQFQISLGRFTRGIVSFLVHILFWKDGTYEFWDPLPWFFLYHVYWPMQFLHCLRTGMKWTRINVSTLKMFECLDGAL